MSDRVARIRCIIMIGEKRSECFVVFLWFKFFGTEPFTVVGENMEKLASM